MSDNDETWIFTSAQNARLDELLALFGCANEIAPLEELAKRAAELIYLTARKGGECAD